MKIARRTLTALASIALCCALVACNAAPAPEPAGPGSYVPVVRVTGEMQSATTRKFGAPIISDIWQYTIAFMAPEGTRATKGQEILRFDAQELKTQLQAKANALNEKRKELQKQEILARERLAELSLLVEEARADLDKAGLKADIPVDLLARRDYRENQLLLEQARLTLSQRRAAVEKEAALLATEARILQREIDALGSEVGELEASIDAMTVTAPGDGVVIHALDRGGNKMAVGDNVWGGRPVVEFPDLSQLELRLEIAERDAARVAVGQPVTFTLDAVPDRVFYGEVTELAAVVHTRSADQPARVIDARVALRDPDPELMRPGMSVNAQVQLPAVEERGP